MSGFITSAGENYLLSLISNAEDALRSYYVALVRTQSPSRFMDGSELDEPLAASYRRLELENTSGAWTERTQLIANVRELSFDPAVQEWGQIQYWALCDRLVGGRVLWAGSLPRPIFVPAASQVSLAPGSLTLSAVNYSSQVVL